MPKIKGEGRVEVPASATEVKAWFHERPSDAVIREIKDSIRENGDVLLCRYNTHTRPPADGEIVYRAEFEIPEKFTRLKLWAPCPVCSSSHRKFGRGKIAWFPEEGVIRLIGADCFKTLNKEAHEEAEAAFRAFQKRRAAFAYLTKSAGLLRRLWLDILDTIKIGEAIDTFAMQFRNTVQEKLAIALWQNIQTGELFTWQARRELVARTGEVREMAEKVVYAKIQGFNLLRPNLKSYKRELEQIRDALANLDDLEAWEASVAGMSDEDRDAACRLVSGAVAASRKTLAEMRDLQRFIEPVTINTLNRWGSFPECPCSLFIERTPTSIRVGRLSNAKWPLKIPEHFDDELPTVQAPVLKEIKVDE